MIVLLPRKRRTPPPLTERLAHHRLAEEAVARLTPVAAAVRETAAHQAQATRSAAAPRVEAARVWAAPRIEHARDWAAPRVETAVVVAREDLLPKLAAAVATALATVEPVRDEARNRSTAAVQALKGDVAPVSGDSRRGGKALLIGSIAVGGALAGAKAWSARRPDPWGDVSAYTPPVGPATAEPAPPVPAVPLADDAAGAGPDETLADGATEDPTTPATTAPAEPIDPLAPPLAQGQDQRP